MTVLTLILFTGMKDLPVYELCLDDDFDGIEVVSLVKYPAVKRNFIAMAKEDRDIHKFSVTSEEMHLATGVLIIPDTPIYRKNEEYGEHYVTFSKETIRDIMYRFHCHGNGVYSNTEHWNFVDNVYMVESYIKDSEKGISPILFADIPDGSWFGTYRIANLDVWERIKNGDFQGFSIEGYLSYKEDTINIMHNLLKKLRE